MDITAALAPKSDQLDAVDLVGSPPQVFTVTDVSEGNAEQPVNIRLAEFPRVWRPSKGMLRVLAGCWGKVTADWVGRRVELYTDPDVMFGPDRVGGVRISRLSHIDKRTSVPMIIKRGKSGSWNVDPLPDAEPAPDAKPMSKRTSERLNELMTTQGISDPLPGVISIIGREVTALDQLTELEGAEVVARLQARAEQGAAS